MGGWFSSSDSAKGWKVTEKKPVLLLRQPLLPRSRLASVQATHRPWRRPLGGSITFRCHHSRQGHPLGIPPANLRTTVGPCSTWERERSPLSKCTPSQGTRPDYLFVLFKCGKVLKSHRRQKCNLALRRIPLLQEEELRRGKKNLSVFLASFKSPLLSQTQRQWMECMTPLNPLPFNQPV